MGNRKCMDKVVAGCINQSFYSGNWLRRFHSKWFGCNEQLAVFTKDVLTGAITFLCCIYCRCIFIANKLTASAVKPEFHLSSCIFVIPTNCMTQVCCHTNCQHDCVSDGCLSHIITSLLSYGLQRISGKLNPNIIVFQQKPHTSQDLEKWKCLAVC